MEIFARQGETAEIPELVCFAPINKFDVTKYTGPVTALTSEKIGASIMREIRRTLAKSGWFFVGFLTDDTQLPSLQEAANKLFAGEEVTVTSERIAGVLDKLSDLGLWSVGKPTLDTELVTDALQAGRLVVDDRSLNKGWYF